MGLKMNNPELTVLNIEVQKLNKRRQEIIDKIYDKNLQEFLTLEWTKSTDARLQINTMWSIGTAKYQIFLRMNPIPNLPKDLVTVYGNHEYYQDNMLFSSKSYMNDKPYLYTSNDYTLKEFLSKYKFQSFDFDVDLANTFIAIKEIYNV